MNYNDFVMPDVLIVRCLGKMKELFELAHFKKCGMIETAKKRTRKRALRSKRKVGILEYR